MAFRIMIKNINSYFDQIEENIIKIKNFHCDYDQNKEIITMIKYDQKKL